jgi:hypothetical protein
LQIRLAELKKSIGGKIVVPEARHCRCLPKHSSLDMAQIVHISCRADALVVDDTTNGSLSAAGVATPGLTPLSSYNRSHD